MTPNPARNRLLESLPASVRDSLLADAENVDLDFGQVIWESGQPVRCVHFPVTGFISQLFSVEGRDNLEMALVGREGMIGIPLVLGVDTSIMKALVQGAGTSMRVNAERFGEELERHPELRQQLHRYIHVTMTQLALSSACNRFHSLRARLARWLLLTHDRSETRSFRLTHEFLAQMLGVRRVGVTNAAGEIQEQGLIRYARGIITVADRVGLERVSCSCYRSAEETYAQVLG